MAWLYKLIDEREMKLAQKGELSFSRPLFEFQSEGKFVNFAKSIYEDYKINGLNIKPNLQILNDIHAWIEAYKMTYGSKINDIDLITETMVIFCGIIQGYCSYLTGVNFDNKEVLKKYLSKVRLKNKIGYIKIDDSIFSKVQHLKTNDLQKPFSLYFGKMNDNDYYQGFNGFTHLIEIEYTEKYNDYYELLKLFNKDERRDMTLWYNNLPLRYSFQKERRIVLHLNSLEKNTVRAACEKEYNMTNSSCSLEERIYAVMVSSLHYSVKGPRYLTLALGKENIEIHQFKNLDLNTNKEKRLTTSIGDCFADFFKDFQKK